MFYPKPMVFLRCQHIHSLLNTHPQKILQLGKLLVLHSDTATASRKDRRAAVDLGEVGLLKQREPLHPIRVRASSTPSPCTALNAASHAATNFFPWELSRKHPWGCLRISDFHSMFPPFFQRMWTKTLSSCSLFLSCMGNPSGFLRQEEFTIFSSLSAISYFSSFSRKKWPYQPVHLHVQMAFSNPTVILAKPYVAFLHFYSSNTKLVLSFNTAESATYWISEKLAQL